MRHLPCPFCSPFHHFQLPLSLNLCLEWAVPRTSRPFHASIALWVRFPLSGVLSHHLHMTNSYLPFTIQLKQLLLSNLSWFPPNRVKSPLFSGTEVPRLGFSCPSLASCAFVCMPVLLTDCELLKGPAHFCSSPYSQDLACNETKHWMNDWINKFNLLSIIINKQENCWKYILAPALPIRPLVNVGSVYLFPWVISPLGIEIKLRIQIYKTGD